MQAAEESQAETLERRSEARRASLMHAFVSDFEGHVDLKCVIRDISKNGCRIASSYVSDLPRLVLITPEGFERPMIAKIVWRNSKFAGVEFVSAEEAEALKAARPDPEAQVPPQDFFGKLFSFAALRRSSGHARPGDERGSGFATYGARALNVVRQPIRSIKGLLGLLLDDPGEPVSRKARSVIYAAHRNASEAEAVLDDALHAENIENGALACRIEPVEIVELARDTALLCAGDAAINKVRFEIVDELGSAMVEADPRRLQEVLRNLLAVSARFSPVGSTVFLGLRKACGSVRVSVSDSGAGSDVQHGDADGTHGGRQGDAGTGLELDVVRAILTRHNSELKIDARPGHGTTVWFELPVVAA